MKIWNFRLNLKSHFTILWKFWMLHLPFAHKLRSKRITERHKWPETETVSPTLSNRNLEFPHIRETIVFLLLDDYFPFTHCKLTEVKSLEYDTESDAYSVTYWHTTPTHSSSLSAHTHTHIWTNTWVNEATQIRNLDTTRIQCLEVHNPPNK